MSWFNQLFGKKESSSSIAKSRLQMVLTHDRSDISPGLLEQIKDEIIYVIAQHIQIDPENVEVNLDHTTKESRLVAEIPIASGRR